MDGKFWRKNGKKFFFGVCLIRLGERKISVELFLFVLNLKNKRVKSCYSF